VSLELRPVTRDELTAFASTLGLSFGWTPDPEEMPFFEDIIGVERTLAAFDDGVMAGTAGAISFQLTLPGETAAPAAGVTVVSVLPTHRRRGVLSAMMRRQLDDFRDREEPLAILLASESIIYGRYGYGLATTQVDYEIERRYAGFRSEIDVPGTMSIVEKDRARELLPPLYERIRPCWPGFLDRRDVWWDLWMKDPERDRHGASARFYAVYQRDGETEGYVAYRIKSDWSEGIARNEAQVADLMTATPEAYVAVWRYLLSLDLIQSLRFHSRPIDEPIRWMLADPRRLRFRTVSDHLWVRLVDIPAALEARQYGVEGAVSFAIEDPFSPDNSGTYHLEAGPQGATCRRDGSDPDLALRVDDLGATYLGGVSFRTLARAGRVEEHTAGAIRRADALFATETAPWCANEF
jgi:predicted acetyltransferase